MKIKEQHPMKEYTSNTKDKAPKGRGEKKSIWNKQK
jgi:hypothetical protein